MEKTRLRVFSYRGPHFDEKSAEVWLVLKTRGVGRRGGGRWTGDLGLGLEQAAGLAEGEVQRAGLAVVEGDLGEAAGDRLEGAGPEGLVDEAGAGGAEGGLEGRRFGGGEGGAGRGGRGPLRGGGLGEKLGEEAGGGLRAVAKEQKLVLRPGDGDVEEPPLLLVGPQGRGALRRVPDLGGRGRRGQNAVHGVHDHDPGVLEALAAVDRAEHEGAAGVAAGAQQVAEVREPREEPGGGPLPGRQLVQEPEALRVAALLQEPGPEARLAADAREGLPGRQVPEARHGALQRQEPRRQRVARGRRVPDRLIERPEQAEVRRGAAALQRRGGVLPPHGQGEFPVDPQEGGAGPGVQRQRQDVPDAGDGAALEERPLPGAAAEGDAVPVQPVDEGHGAVVVAEEDGGLPVLPGEGAEPVVLGGPARQVHGPHRRAAGAHGLHGLGPAQGIARDEAP